MPCHEKMLVEFCACARVKSRKLRLAAAQSFDLDVVVRGLVVGCCVARLVAAAAAAAFRAQNTTHISHTTRSRIRVCRLCFCHIQIVHATITTSRRCAIEPLHTYRRPTRLRAQIDDGSSGGVASSPRTVSNSSKCPCGTRTLCVH